MEMTMIQHKKILKEEMKDMTNEQKIDMCYRLTRDSSKEMKLRLAANSIFCSLVDVHGWLCGMANESVKNRRSKC